MCLGNIFGKPKVETPKITPVAPPPTVQTADTSTDTGMEQQKKKKGFASTKAETDTILGGSNTGTRQTLG